MRIHKRNILFKLAYITGINYQAPSNFSYFWNLGSLALFCILLQIATGLFLSFYYIPEWDKAFVSIEIINNEIQFGWWMRYFHSNGASLFFIVLYIHMFRGLYYSSYIYPRHLLWISGMIIYLLSVATAFLGYILPWGQMSFWAATVITNLFSTIPFVGTDMVYWLWGGFSVDEATLNRFYSLHFMLPFIIFSTSLLHVVLLHEFGSNNPLAIPAKLDYITMSPYYLIKDLYGIIFTAAFFFFLVYFVPNYLGHTDNYIFANPLLTPEHIVPEWYFLFFYAILRSVPNKLLGVIVLLLAILLFFFAPFFLNFFALPIMRTPIFNAIFKYVFWGFIFNCLALTWIGGQTTDFPYYQFGQFFTILFFVYIIVIFPLVRLLELSTFLAYYKVHYKIT